MLGIYEKKEHFDLLAKKIKGFIGYPAMFHPHIELLYVISGSINTVIDGKEHTLLEGELSLIFPYITHSYEDSPDAEVILIMLDLAQIPFDRTFLTKKPTKFFTCGRNYSNMLERAVELISVEKTKTALGYITAVIGEFIEAIELVDTTSVENDTTIRILEYCRENFAQKISIKSVSDKTFVSESYVTKIFSRKFKCKFREYINILRIEKAKYLLESSNKKIVDIMLECGFENQSSFNRIFKEKCGVSPFEYRKKE